MDIFLYKQLVQVQQAKSLTLSYLYTCLMLIPVELDKSTMGIILCIIMHYRTWTLKIKSSMCIIFASRVSTLVEQLRCVMEPVVTVCFQAGDKQLILSLAV